MITEEHCKEKLNRSFVLAIGSMAGLMVGFYPDEYGIDGYFKEVKERNGRRCMSGAHLDYQLKATENWKIRNDYIVYNLESKTYNDLVDTYNDPYDHCPLILILLCLPNEKKSWLTANTESLIMKNCCYWFCIDDSYEHKNNKSSVTIRIPSSNLLNPESIVFLMDKINSNKPIN